MNTEPKLFDLSLSQGVVYYQLQFSLDKAVSNINSTLHLDGDIDVSLMQQAMFLALCRNKSVSVRMRKCGKTIKQYFSPEMPEKIEYVDYTGKTAEEMNADIKKWCCTPFANKFIDIPLYHAKFLHEPDGKYSFFFCVSHLAFDAYALLYMSNDALYIYDRMINGKPIEPVVSDPVGCIADEAAYMKSKRFAEDEEYWKKVLDTEPYYVNCTPNKDLRAKDKRYGKTAAILLSKAHEQNLTVPAELVSAVNAFCDKYSVNPHSVYTVVLRQYLSKINGNTDDVSITTTSARRATLKQKRSGGTRVQSLMFRMHYSNELTVLEACRKNSDMQTEIYRHGEYPLLNCINYCQKRYGAKIANGYNSMMFTYQPTALVQRSGFKASLSVYGNGNTSMPMYLTIMGLDDSGALNCNYLYPTHLTDDAAAPLMHEALLKGLRYAVEHPEGKISGMLD